MKRLVLVMLGSINLLAQTKSSTAPANATPVSGAMEQSLAQQQAAITAFRDAVQTQSIAQQQQSILNQMQALQPQTVPQKSDNVKTAATPAGEPAGHSLMISSEFFAVPWPGSLPLSVPNVQMPDLSCSALDGSEVNTLVQTAAQKHGLDTALLKSVMKQESAFKPCALSTAGAMGLMQIMPDTADMLHLDDPFDPQKNVDAGAKFLKTMLDRFGGNVAMALAAYNAGPSTVDKAGGIPPIAETLQYVSNILGELPIAY